MNLIGIIFAIAIFSTAANADNNAASDKNNKVFDEISKMHWVDHGKVTLPSSHSSISVPDGYSIIVGKEAQRLMELFGNSSNPDEEAVALNRNDSMVVFGSTEDGYVSVDDWSDVDAGKMLSSIIENTDELNKERANQNIPALHVTGWLQQPTLDRQTNTVYWTLDAVSGDEKIVNSIALRLGRHGYEKLTWVDSKDHYSSVGGELDVMMRAHSFDPGHSYTDHVETDKVAAYGISGLVGAVAGVKLLKAAAAGGLILLIKKFGIFILALFAAGLSRLKGMFSRKPSE